MSIPKSIFSVFVLCWGFLLAACGVQSPSIGHLETTPLPTRTTPASINEIEAYFVTQHFRFETLEPAFHGQRRVGLLEGGVVQLELHGEPTAPPVYVTWTMTGPGANERVKDYLDEMTVLARMVAPSWRGADRWLSDVMNINIEMDPHDDIDVDGYHISLGISEQVVSYFLKAASETY